MKKYLLTAVIALLSIGAFAHPTEKYCDVNVDRPWFKNYIAYINYGDVPQDQAPTIKDDSGKTVKFPSVLAAINYMRHDGWQLVNSYYTRSEGLHFIFKKEE